MFVPILLYSRQRGSSGIISSAIFSAYSLVLPINCIVAFILPSLTCSLVANSLLCWSRQWMQYLSSNLDVVFSSSSLSAGQMSIRIIFLDGVFKNPIIFIFYKYVLFMDKIAVFLTFEHSEKSRFRKSRRDFHLDRYYA